MYTFVKGATGDQQTVPLQLLNQKHTGDWGSGWCGPTAAGISLGWFAETDPQFGKLIPGADSVQIQMAELDFSGQSGTATLTASGDKTLLAVNLTPAQLTMSPSPCTFTRGSVPLAGASTMTLL